MNGVGDAVAVGTAWVGAGAVAVAAIVGVGVIGAGAGDAHADRITRAIKTKKRNVFFDMNAPEFWDLVFGS